MIEQIFLIRMPRTGLIQVERVGDLKLFSRLHGMRFSLQRFQKKRPIRPKLQETAPFSREEHQRAYDRAHHRIAKKRGKLQALEPGAVFHGFFHHLPGPCILFLQIFVRLLQLLHMRMLSEPGGYAFQLLLLLPAPDGALSFLIHAQADLHILHGRPFHERLHGLDQPRLHGQLQPRHVRITCPDAQIHQSDIRRLAFVRPPLGTELPAFLPEFLDKLVALQHILLPVFPEGRQAIAHKQVFISLRRNLLRYLGKRNLSSGRIRVFSGAGMLLAVRDVFCRLVQPVEVFLAQLAVRLLKPRHVKGAVLQFLRRQRRIAGDDRFLLVVKPLVHMGHEIITAAL